MGGRGFVSQLVRLHLDWEDASVGPASLVVKLHASDRSRATLAKMVYEREYLFYQHFAARSPIPTPHCYYAAYDPAEIRFVLVLEDLSELKAGDQVAGTTDANVETAIYSLAKLHAEFWNDEEVRTAFGGMVDAPTDIPKDALEFLRTSLDEIKASRAKQLPMIILNAEVVLEILSAPDFKPRPPQLPSPFTLVNGDYRLDNMFFGGNANPMVVIDWGVGMGSGSSDLGFFLSLSLTAEQLLRQGHALTRLYHRTLVEHGVQDYSLRQLKNECILQSAGHAFALMLMQVIADRIAKGELSIGRESSSIGALVGAVESFVSGITNSDRGSLFFETMMKRTEASLGFWVPGGRPVARLVLKLLRGALRLRNRYLRWRRTPLQ